MENKVSDFLSYVEKETEISIDFSSIEITGYSESLNVEDIDTIDSLTNTTYLAKISIKSHPLILTLECCSTQTCEQIVHIELLTLKGSNDFVAGAIVQYQLYSVAPDIPVYITSF